jgi:hypothetical protein
LSQIAKETAMSRRALWILVVTALSSACAQASDPDSNDALSSGEDGEDAVDAAVGPGDIDAADPIEDPPDAAGNPVTSIDAAVPACGDGTCNGSESCATCTADCGACPPACGDGTCNGSESCATCSADCGTCPSACGDGTCNGTETCSSCKADCGTCPPACGDGMCNGSETCSSCKADCGACPPACGDGMCNGTESCSSCAGDCGGCAAPPHCGDRVCNGNETCTSCRVDCGLCEDVFCPNCNIFTNQGTCSGNTLIVCFDNCYTSSPCPSGYTCDDDTPGQLSQCR